MSHKTAASLALAFILLTGACHKPAPVAVKTAPVTETPPPAPPGPPACTLTADPDTVEQGKSVTLSWQSKDAADVDLSPGPGKVQAEGSTSVTPTESTTYTLSLKGPGGATTCVTRITVTPAAPATASVKESNLEPPAAVVGTLRDAYFDLDKSDIRPDASQALTDNAKLLEARPSLRVTIEGHCDQRGSEEYNLGLGDRRATTAKNFIVNLGVAASRIDTISFGKDRPVCTESTEDCWQMNRRAHFAPKP